MFINPIERAAIISSEIYKTFVMKTLQIGFKFVSCHLIEFFYLKNTFSIGFQNKEYRGRSKKSPFFVKNSLNVLHIRNKTLFITITDDEIFFRPS